VGLHAGAEACQQEAKEVEEELRAGLTIGRGTEAYAADVWQMRARGVAMPNLSQKELEGGDGRAHAVAPGGLAGLLACAEDGFWLSLGRPLRCESAQHGGDTGDHRSTSCMCCDHRPLHTGDIMVAQRRLHPYKLTTYPSTYCHSALGHIW
jgi:hypothetical protein